MPIEQGVKILLEAAAKLKCNVTIKTRALIFYHQFKRLSGDVKYDPCTIAAAAINLSSRVDEEVIDIDDLINLFYCIYHRTTTVLDVTEETFILLKRSVMAVDRLMWRKFEFDFNYKAPQQYVTDFLCSVFEHIRMQHAFNKSITITCMQFMCDFYTDSIATHYPPEHVAVACISAALDVHGIFRSDMNIREPWFAFFTDITEDRLKKIRSVLFGLYDGDKAPPRRIRKQTDEEFDYLYSDQPPVLTDLRNLQK